MYVEAIDNPEKDMIKIKITNDAVKLINSALAAYKGDENNLVKKELRHEWLAVRNILNPS